MMQDRLLDVAIREFGLKGLDGASTRAIAAAADTAMSSITYHYGSKDALYLAAADHIAAQMAEEMAPTLALCDPAGSCDAAAARENIHRVMALLAARMANAGNADRTLFILREQMNPGEAFERIYAGMMGTLVRHLSALIAIVTGCPAVDARVATVTMVGQVLAIRASHGSILRLCDIESLDPIHADLIVQRIHANVDAILDRMANESE